MISIIISIIAETLVCLGAGSILFWTIRLGIGPTPTSGKVRAAVADILPDTVHGDIIELGCGWGHLMPVLQAQYPHTTIQGWERSPLPALFTHWFRKAKVIRKDFFTADLSSAGLVVCYLYPGAMARIEQEIIPRLPPGCWLVSHTFSLPDSEPVRTLKANDMYQTPVYLYQKANT